MNAATQTQQDGRERASFTTAILLLRMIDNASVSSFCQCQLGVFTFCLTRPLVSPSVQSTPKRSFTSSTWWTEWYTLNFRLAHGPCSVQAEAIFSTGPRGQHRVKCRNAKFYQWSSAEKIKTKIKYELAEHAGDLERKRSLKTRQLVVWVWKSRIIKEEHNIHGQRPGTSQKRFSCLVMWPVKQIDEPQPPTYNRAFQFNAIWRHPSCER